MKYERQLGWGVRAINKKYHHLWNNFCNTKKEANDIILMSFWGCDWFMLQGYLRDDALRKTKKRWGLQAVRTELVEVTDKEAENE